MMLVLLVMILRTCAIEFRSKRQAAAWRTLWDAVFALTSFGLALLLGRRLRQHPAAACPLTPPATCASR